MKLAIFPNETTISVLVPAPNCGLTLEQICAKDVPTGVKLKLSTVQNFQQTVNFGMRGTMISPTVTME